MEIDVLIKRLKELILTEGRGMPIIHSELEKNGSSPPIFETDDERSYFLCTIKIHPLSTHERNLKPTDVTKDKTKDKELVISSLKDVDRYLRSLDDQRWETKKNKIVSEVKDLFLKVLHYCINPKTREEIFNYIGVFNNSRNFGNYIKPVVDLGWVSPTIPGKPTSKNQKYITSEIAKRLIEQKAEGIIRNPVESSNIASVGYDAENRILEIEFNHGAVYQYFDVPKEEHEALINASAIGSYFFHSIRNNYNNEKL